MRLGELEPPRAVIDFLLAAEFQGVEALRDQARHAQVTGAPHWQFWLWPFGRSSTRKPGTTCAGHPNRPRSESGFFGDEPFELVLFQAHGWLVAVELLWYGESPPVAFPDLG